MTVEKPHPIAQAMIQRWNKRIPKSLDVEDVALPKKLRKARFTAFQALEQIFDLLDRYYAFSKGLTPCQRGCAYCCHSEIVLSKVEADYIAAKTGAIPVTPIRFLEFRSVIYCDSSRPCPFLTTDGACSIYEYRPMLCRTHVTFEATDAPCRFDSTHTSVGFVDRASSFPGTMRAYMELVERYRPHGGGFADIREYFGSTRRAFPIGVANAAQPKP